MYMPLQHNAKNFSQYGEEMNRTHVQSRPAPPLRGSHTLYSPPEDSHRSVHQSFSPHQEQAECDYLYQRERAVSDRGSKVLDGQISADRCDDAVRGSMRSSHQVRKNPPLFLSISTLHATLDLFTYVFCFLLLSVLIAPCPWFLPMTVTLVCVPAFGSGWK